MHPKNVPFLLDSLIELSIFKGIYVNPVHLANVIYVFALELFLNNPSGIVCKPTHPENIFPKLLASTFFSNKLSGIVCNFVQPKF